MVRQTERFVVEWGEAFEVVPLSEDRKGDIAALLHRTKAPLYGKAKGGDLAECLAEVDRYLDYHRAMELYPVFLEGSSLVYDRAGRQLVAMCLMAGTPEVGHVFDLLVAPEFRGRGIATRMLRRALTVYADTHDSIDLECDAASPARRLYEKLGFVSHGPVD